MDEILIHISSEIVFSFLEKKNASAFLFKSFFHAELADLTRQ